MNGYFFDMDGTLYNNKFHEVSEKTLKLIDEMEGYFGKGNPNNEYNKEICDIYDENNQIIDQAYVYVFNMDNRRNVSALENDIESHDYVKYIQEIKRNEKTYSIDE